LCKLFWCCFIDCSNLQFFLACDECDSFSNCLTCKFGFFRADLQNDLNFSCVKQCPSTQYGDTVTLECKNCSSECAECDGVSTACTKCNSGKVLFNESCIDKCPQNWFVFADALYGNYCLSECGANQYPDNTDSECKPCNGACYRCSGPLQTQCTACDAGTYLKVLSSTDMQCVNADTCTGTNTESYYTLGDPHNLCESCHYTCATCNGPTNLHCLSCDNITRFMYANLSASN